MAGWSSWRRFPDPRQGGVLIAPFGAGCYEIRRSDDRESILFGMAGHTAERMTSLLPSPLGKGVRNNAGKREYLLAHLPMLEYRTLACLDRDEARREEAKLKVNASRYRFPT